MDNELDVWINFNPHSNKAEAKKKSATILQKLLAEYSHKMTPFEIKRTENGKPYIDQPIHFSYAHCRQVYVYAVQKHQPLGIDLEYINSNRSYIKLAQRYFHADEYRQLTHLSKKQQASFFYQLWTEKEALCKLHGGVLWHYLKKKNSRQNTVKLNSSDLFVNYAFTLATKNTINNIRFNTIA